MKVGVGNGVSVGVGNGVGVVVGGSVGEGTMVGKNCVGVGNNVAVGVRVGKGVKVGQANVAVGWIGVKDKKGVTELKRGGVGVTEVDNRPTSIYEAKQ